MDVCRLAEFSASGPVRKDLMKTAGPNIEIVGLETGQVIPPHPEPYVIVFGVFRCEGVITAGTTEHPVKPHHLVSIKKDENRGIRPDQKMVIPGIREDV